MLTFECEVQSNELDEEDEAAEMGDEEEPDYSFAILSVALVPDEKVAESAGGKHSYSPLVWQLNEEVQDSMGAFLEVSILGPQPSDSSLMEPGSVRAGCLPPASPARTIERVPLPGPASASPLQAHGLDSELLLYLVSVQQDKEQREYVSWLQTARAFLS